MMGSASQDYEDLTPEEHLELWKQFVGVRADSQKAYDVSIRILAAGGIGVAASLVTAVHTVGAAGLGALAAFLGSLLLNVVSHLSADRDMVVRLASLTTQPAKYPTSNRWGRWTVCMNLAAGATLIAGACFLAVFVATTPEGR